MLKKDYQKNLNTIYFIDKFNCSNQYLRKSISKEFNVQEWARIPIFVCKKIPYLNHLYDETTHLQGRDKEGLTKSRMPKFENNEINFCMDWLKSYGWKGPRNQLFVYIQGIRRIFLKYSKTHHMKIWILVIIVIETHL